MAALDEPTRRRLYDHVVGKRAPVSRDGAAAALELPRTTAAFHLDRLVELGLLEVVYERRTGRSGPGAGRPAKLYLRSGCDVSVSLPQRHYDLAGRLLAAAVQEAQDSGQSPRAVLDRHAQQFGAGLARSAAAAGHDPADLRTVLTLLAEQGYEPYVDGATVVLVNCPFHVLAQEHTELVCGMNLRLLDGLLAELAVPGVAAELCPAAGHCCVRLRHTG